MGKNVIVSEETIRDLLEAHASMSAWYYALWAGLRAVSASAQPPDDAARLAFMERLAIDYPELSGVARSIKAPRMFVPAPPTFAIAPSSAGPADEQATVIEPAAARLRGEAPALAVPPPPAADGEPSGSSAAGIAPPPMVNPAKVKYGP
jgi:hypothetical protein